MDETTREMLQKQLALLSEHSQYTSIPDDLYKLTIALIDVAKMLVG